MAAVSCSSAPKPTVASLKIRENSPAIVEGRVTDERGRPVAGIAVRGIPRGKDIPWFPPVSTACDGRFQLPLAAPGGYGFLLLWKGTAVITPSPEDPSRLDVRVWPGQMRDGVDLVFLDAEWRQVTESAPADTPSCP